MAWKWADDSQRLILEHFDMIQDSPSEIYNYALPFSPSSSWLHQHYSPELSKQVRVVTGSQAEWGRCSRTVSSNYFYGPLECWGNIIAASSICCIITLDAITGITISILSGHIEGITSLTFSLDGTFLASTSDDETIKLWDIQTGGIVKTFHGHTSGVCSASISPDCTTIASGSYDHKIYLWNIQTGACYCIIDKHSSAVKSVCFSPTNSQLLISASNDGTTRCWDVNGHEIGCHYNDDHAAFSPDGIYIVSWSVFGMVATIRNLNSGVIVAKINAPVDNFAYLCFSPNGKFLAGTTFNAIHIWSFTESDPFLVETKNGSFRTIALSSSHLFSCSDGSIKFWPIRTFLANKIIADSESTQHNSALPMSVTLQAKEGITILTDSAGMVRAWDLSTGLCKLSFHTKAGPESLRDTLSIDGKLVFTWCTRRKVHIWNTGREECLQTVDAISDYSTTNLKISGDGSKVFLQDHKYVQALSTWTGEVMGKVKLEGELSDDPFIVDGSRVWVCFEDLQTKGWDFGIPGLAPVPLSDIPPNPNRPHLKFINCTEDQSAGPSRIENMVTGEEVYRLPKRYQKPTIAQWDGQYLVTVDESGQVLILDFTHMIPQQSPYL